MDDPTTADVAAAFKYLTNLESGFPRVPEEAELNEFRKAIQDGRMKTVSAPWAFIMSVNMNGSASNRGTAVDRRMLLTISMRSFSPPSSFAKNCRVVLRRKWLINAE